MLQKCSEDVEFVFPLAKKLSDIDSLASTILFLWVYFVGKLRDGIGKPPNSSRAAAFTIERREARQDQMQKFLRDDKISDAALEEVGEPQALRYLGIVFNLVEEVGQRKVYFGDIAGCYCSCEFDVQNFADIRDSNHSGCCCSMFLHVDVVGYISLLSH